MRISSTRCKTQNLSRI